MAETQTLNPISDNTDSSGSAYSGSDDDGTPSELFFSDDECPADPPPASPPPVENPLGHLLPECTKCAAKLACFFDKMEAAYGMSFDECGVAVLPEVAGCRDRGTVAIRTHCLCPKVTRPKVTCPKVTCPEVTCPEVTCPEVTCPEVTDFSFSQADYQSLFV
jgi:hypothetical protein